MKEQIIRSIGLVVSAAVLGGCLVWAASLVSPPRYEFVPMSRTIPGGQTSQVLARGDRLTGDAQMTVSSYANTVSRSDNEIPKGFVEESQVSR